MENENFNTSEVCGILNEIMEYELSGVVRYTHSSLMVTGPHRLPIRRTASARTSKDAKRL